MQKLAEVAAEFDGIHSIRRAVEVGSVDAVIQASELRPRLIEALRIRPALSVRSIPTDLVDFGWTARHAGRVSAFLRSPFSAVRRLHVDLMRLSAAGCPEHG